jgi:3-oxoacyl-[acyl-carrier-protein] synthase-3
MNLPKPIRITGMGKYLPKLVTSDMLEIAYGLPSGWSEKYSGVKCRHIAQTETNGEMGALAAEQALENAGLSLEHIDMLISASGTYDYPLPNQASVIKAQMKGGNHCHFPAIDIDSTCLSFVAAIEYAAALLDGKAYQHILIVSSEISSKGINPKNWETLTLFGDGAAAFVLSYSANSESAFIKGGQRTYSEGVHDTIIEGGGNRFFFRDYPYDRELHSFKMNGRKLLKMAKDYIPDFMDWFYQDLPFNLLDTDVIVPHQASRMGLSVFTKLYRFKPNQMKETLHKYGNCIAASIPLTFIDAVEKNEIKRGDYCLLSGTSAGFSIGGVLIKY